MVIMKSNCNFTYLASVQIPDVNFNPDLVIFKKTLRNWKSRYVSHLLLKYMNRFGDFTIDFISSTAKTKTYPYPV